MTRLWVPDASPIISLAKVGRLDLLLGGHDRRVVVPRPVLDEILRGARGDAARRAVEAGSFEEAPATMIPAALARRGLGAGESAALAVALASRDATAIVDDLAARRIAPSLGIPIMGTLTVVVQAQLRGLIPSAAAVFRDLRAAGFRIHDRLATLVLEQAVGETWDP